MKPGMKAILTLMVAAGMLVSIGGGQAYAVPTCTSTTTFASGTGTVDITALGTGVCVQAQDKLYGNFTFGNLPTGGTVAFTLNLIGAQDFHQIAINDNFVAGTTYTGFGYQVAVNPVLPNGPRIVSLDADFAQTFGTSTLTKTPSVGGVIIETKTGSVVTSCNQPLPGGVCGDAYPFPPGITEVTVSEQLVDGGTVSSITNTVVELVPSRIPEPASLLLIGAGLAGLGLIRRRRK